MPTRVQKGEPLPTYFRRSRALQSVLTLRRRGFGVTKTPSRWVRLEHELGPQRLVTCVRFLI